MEIRRLDLTAFGLFTNESLSFDYDSGGLYLIFGPNEAGKSSALRGMKALLYGIPERTTDNFIHPNEQLRIGGLLKAGGERRLAFVRRKGRKNTLLTPDGAPLDDEAALNPFLGGVSLELFETLFGIDHSALVQGGRDILEQKGEVGQLLFSAALATPALHTVLEQLEREAEDLFKPRGSIQKINAGVKEFNERNKEIREVSLSSQKWAENRRALSRITKELDQVRDNLAERRKELTRLKRMQRVLPNLARRDKLLQRISDFSEVVVLAEDFKKRRQTTVQELEKAQLIDRKATSRLEQSEAQLRKVQVRQEILDVAEAIETLHELLGSHRKAMKDRPRLEAERSQLLVDVESLLKDVRPGLSLDEVEALRPVLNRRRRITELGNQHQALVRGVADTQKSHQEMKRRLEGVKRARKELPEPAVPDPLRIRKTVAAAAKMGQIDEQLKAKQKEAQALEEECAAQLERLSLWGGTLWAIPGLTLPAGESVDRFEKGYDSLENRKVQLQQRNDELTTGLHEVERQLEEIQRTGMVPTEEDLQEARSERDHAWQLLRRQWLEAEDVQAEAVALDPAHDLPDAFEVRISTADDLADRLRREADRVHRQAGLVASQSGHKRRLGDVRTHLGDLTQQKADLDNQWRGMWSPCGIVPLTPREMRAWLAVFDKLRDKVAQLQALQRETEEIVCKRDDHVRALKQELDAFGKEIPDSATSLRSVLSAGEDVAEEMERLLRRREELDKDIERVGRDLQNARSDLQAADRELEAWNATWQEEMISLGLDADTRPSDATEILEKIGDLFSKHRETEKLRIRIEGIEKDAQTFQDQVKEVATRIAPEMTDSPAEQAVVRFNLLLKENRSGDTLRRKINEDLEQAEEEIRDARATIETMTARLQELCVEARCEQPDSLEAAERRSDEFQGSTSMLASLEGEILEAGEGSPLTELEKEAEEVDPDELPGQIDRLTQSLDEELEPRRTELAEMKGRAETELKLMDGGDRAAELAGKALGVLARIRHDAGQYVRLRLAARILRQEIERYRRENEGPLVQRAGEYFSVLTCGSFEFLRVDFNERDEPVLVGLRPGGQAVHVEGMSSGTRDQLYLALRLAALERYMDSSEPMPFIVDDILIQFDDDRSAATLKVLAEFGKKTQVILFTHHSRLVEQARSLDAAVPVSVHEL